MLLHKSLDKCLKQDVLHSNRQRSSCNSFIFLEKTTLKIQLRIKLEVGKIRRLVALSETLWRRRLVLLEKQIIKNTLLQWIDNKERQHQPQLL